MNWPNDETRRYLTRQPQKRKPEPKSEMRYWIGAGIGFVLAAWMWILILSGGRP